MVCLQKKLSALAEKQEKKKAPMWYYTVDVINEMQEDVRSCAKEIQNRYDRLLTSWTLQRHAHVRAKIHEQLSELNWIHKLITGETYDEFVKRKVIEEQKKLLVGSSPSEDTKK